MILYHIKYQPHAYDKPLINKQAASSEFEAIQKHIADGFNRKEIISIYQKGEEDLIG